MKILLVVGIVLAAFLLLIAVILLLPVRVIIKYGDGDEVKLLYRFLGKTFGENPDPNNIIVKSAKKLTGISRFDSIGTVKGSIEDMGVSATAGQIADILMSLLGRVVWILKYCVAERFFIKAVCAGDDAADAAMEYGAVCAVVYPLVGYFRPLCGSGKKVSMSMSLAILNRRIPFLNLIRCFVYASFMLWWRFSI